MLPPSNPGYQMFDKDRGGSYSWDELQPIIRDFFGNLWTANRPKEVDEGGDHLLEEQDERKIESAAGGGPAVEAPLPPNWYAVKNPNATGAHDAVYYANSQTNETMWTRPV